MTYREAILSQWIKLSDIYENAENLRDAATEEEKLYWNDIRTIIADAKLKLIRLDKGLKPERASFKLKGKY